jgi:hypothetical protein
MGVGPATTHQVAVPAQQRLGLDEEPLARRSRQETSQTCEHGSIGWSERGPGDLSTKHGDLVAENDDLDGQISCVTPLQPQQLEHPNEAEVEEGQGQRPPSSVLRRRCNSPAQRLRMTFSAPTGFDLGIKYLALYSVQQHVNRFERIGKRSRVRGPSWSI